MASVERSIEIQAAPESVFDLIHDYDRRLAWDPFLRKATLLGGAKQAALGVSSVCKARWRNGARRIWQPTDYFPGEEINRWYGNDETGWLFEESFDLRSAHRNVTSHD